MQDQWSQAKDDRDFKCNKKKTAGETAAAAQDAYDEAEKEEKLSQTTFTEAAKKEELDADELQKVSKLVAQTKEKQNPLSQHRDGQMQHSIEPMHSRRVPKQQDKTP